MKKLTKKIIQFPWRYKQGLTAIPNEPEVPVSDLFVWRNSKDWETYFDLINISSLFDDSEKVNVVLYFYDSTGQLMRNVTVELSKYQKKTLEISKYVQGNKCEYGTFCVFHSSIPDVITEQGSFLTERGYLSFRYKSSPVRAYVHGNLDAVALSKKNKITSLARKSFLKREYRVQYQLVSNNNYDVVVVNPLETEQKVICCVIDSVSNNMIDTFSKNVLPFSPAVFSISIDEGVKARVVIKSKLVMARPVIFSFDVNGMDVFHS